MEIPVINRMTDQFEASISSLNNPSLITRLFSIFELGKHLSLPHRVWKWGALFLALAYAFSSVAYRFKTLILHYHGKSKSLLATASEPLLSHFEEDFSSSDEDDVVSSSEEEEEDDDSEDEDDDDRSSSYEDLTRFDYDDFRVKGNFGNFGQKRKFNLHRRRSICDNFSLSDLVSGNGVVKLWENSILGEIQLPAVAMMSPSVVVSAVSGGDDGLFGLWDLRMGRRSPVVQANWKPVRRGNKSVGIDAGRTGKVYVRDGVSEVVGDLRKMDTPLEEDTWWDTVGVAVKEE